MKKKKIELTPMTGVPRIVWLKILYGSDYIDYIKDTCGIDHFLKEIFKKDNDKNNFLQMNPTVKEFSAHWFIMTNYYKTELGQKIRDKDAIDKLSKKVGFKNLPKVYNFRCALFKADFFLDEKFESTLARNLILLSKMTKRILVQKQKKDKFLIENKEW